jgi:tellurite methyltransferase
MPDEVDWEDYYQKIQGRGPRQLLIDALEKFPSPAPRQAIDLGCGDGTESVMLLDRGWHVLAIDHEPAAIRRLMEKAPVEHRARLRTQVAKFEEVVLSPADLIFASLSIPFCKPESFGLLWDKIATAVKPDGRFAGQFFGVKDSWAVDTNMTFHAEDQVRAMFDKFAVEFFHERDEDGTATSGPKHWHVFTVIARKNAG